jgi:hypothetical protein
VPIGKVIFKTGKISSKDFLKLEMWFGEEYYRSYKRDKLGGFGGGNYNFWQQG